MIATSSTTRVSFALSLGLLLVVASLFSPGAIAQRKRSTSRHDCAKVDDAALTASVSAKIAATHSLDGQNINAAAKSGVVTLTGNVTSVAMKNLAASKAGSVECVRSVVNRLAVTPPVIHSDFLCCCDGACWYSNQRCPPCDMVKDCTATYKAAVAAAGKNKAALAAAREAFYECICKAP